MENKSYWALCESVMIANNSIFTWRYKEEDCKNISSVMYYLKNLTEDYDHFKMACEQLAKPARQDVFRMRGDIRDFGVYNEGDGDGWYDNDCDVLIGAANRTIVEFEKQINILIDKLNEFKTDHYKIDWYLDEEKKQMNHFE